MKAVLCKQYGPPETLVVEDVPSPSVSADSVLIEVKPPALTSPTP